MTVHLHDNAGSTTSTGFGIAYCWLLMLFFLESDPRSFGNNSLSKNFWKVSSNFGAAFESPTCCQKLILQPDFEKQQQSQTKPSSSSEKLTYLFGQTSPLTTKLCMMRCDPVHKQERKQDLLPNWPLSK